MDHISHDGFHHANRRLCTFCNPRFQDSRRHGAGGINIVHYWAVGFERNFSLGVDPLPFRLRRDVDAVVSKPPITRQPFLGAYLAVPLLNATAGSMPLSSGTEQALLRR